jgi:hypothetical protein
VPKPRKLPSSGLVANQSGRLVRKWKRQEKAHNDIAQTTFYKAPASQALDFKANTSRYAKIEQKGIDITKKTSCPFCLSDLEIRRFLISTKNKKGINRDKGHCPECSQGMKLKTLVFMVTATPEQYAKFAFDYRSSGFWQKKIDFPVWRRRLAVMDWSGRFWSEYYKLRDGSIPDEQTAKENADFEAQEQHFKAEKHEA